MQGAHAQGTQVLKVPTLVQWGLSSQTFLSSLMLVVLLLLMLLCGGGDAIFPVRRALRDAWRLLKQNPGLTLENGLPPDAKRAVDAATKQMYKHRKKMEKQAGKL